MQFYDLIIVGAGPSGLALAHVCSNIYRRILVIDKEYSIGEEGLLWNIYRIWPENIYDRLL